MPAAGHLCQFVTIGDGSTEITLVKLNNGAAVARPTDTDTESAKRQREGVRERDAGKREGRERRADAGIIKMHRRAVPCGSVLGPGHWPKMVETNDVAGASFGGTSKTFAALARPGLAWSGLASRAELLNRIKISWCIFTDCSSARRVRAEGERERERKACTALGGDGCGHSLCEQFWLLCAQLAAVSSILC